MMRSPLWPRKVAIVCAVAVQEEKPAHVKTAPGARATPSASAVPTQPRKTSTADCASSAAPPVPLVSWAETLFSMIVVMATFIAFQLLAYFTNVMFQLLRVFMFPCVMQLLNLTLKVVQFFPQGILMITIMMFSMVVVMATFMFPMFFVSLALVLTFLPALLMVAI